MRVHRPSRAVCRAAVAVAALYALVLQALLGGLAVPAPIDPLHILCSADAGSGEGPSKPHPAHSHLPCCTVAHGPGTVGPPLPAPVAVIWPVGRAVAVIWRPEVVAAPRAPPGASASARAPPAA